MITVSFYIVTAIILWIFIIAKSKEQLFFFLLTFLLVLDVNRITSSSMMIGPQEINCSDLVLGCSLIVAILILINNKHIDKPLLLIAIMLALSSFASIMWNLLFPSNEMTIVASQTWDAFYYGLNPMVSPRITARSVLVSFRLSTYCVLLFTTASLFCREDYIRAGRIVFNVSKIHITFILLELIAKYVFHTTILNDFAQTLLPNYSSAVEGLVQRGGFYTLQGLTREPSHLATALFFFLIIGVFLNRSNARHKYDRFWMVIAAVLLVVSGAFTAIVGLAVALLLILCLLFENKLNGGTVKLFFDVRVFIFAFLIVGFVVMIAIITSSLFVDIYYFQKIQNVWLNLSVFVNRNYGAISGSADAIPRMISIFESIHIFLSAPILGVGPGVMNPASGLGAMLANYGLLGSVLWFAMMRRYIKCVSFENKSWPFFLVVFGMGSLCLSGEIMYMTVWLLLGGLLGASHENATQADYQLGQNSIIEPSFNNIMKNQDKS